MAIRRSTGTGPNMTKYFIGIVLSLIVFQIVSYVYAFFTGTTAIKLGWAFLLLIGSVVMIALFILGRKFTKVGELERSEYFFIILLIAGIILVFIYADFLIPEIFSSIESPIKETFSAILP